jgi:2-oxoglutarate ferredoxin oxidoreductase subunit alpha
MDRGKVLTAEQIESNGFARYRDVDGDGICYRTIPGNASRRAAYFARGTGHTEAAVYSESSTEWRNNMLRLMRKFETARGLMPRPLLHEGKDAAIGILSFGTNDPAIQEGRSRLAKEGIETDYLRVRALPTHREVAQFLESHDRVYVLENSNEPQMTKIIRMEHSGPNTTRLRPATLGDGLPMTPRWVVSTILEGEQAEEAQS